MKLLKRTLAMLLVLTMVLGMVPFAAFAEETTEGTEGTLPVPDHMATKPANGTATGQPFNDAESVSRNYRIPGLVNHNGTLIATADARYDQEYDGGGIDIVVSRSKDGNTWNYTFPAYLGDNGNKHAKNSSTLMDPLIISDGTDLYLLYDMFPAGWSISGGDNTNHSFNYNGRSGTGFDGEGRLRLGKTYNSTDENAWNYYLDGDTIMDPNGDPTGYTVDGWFNVYKDDAYVSNLFFAESEFYAFPTSYFAMQKSSDNGQTWTDPQLLNVKRSGAWWEVLGPGTGLVTKDGNLAFTAYDGANIYLIYGKENNWKTVQTSAANNESSIVELKDGTIRAFVKNNGNTVSYVDFTPNGDSYTAGDAKSTGIPNTGWCMVSSLLYSRTIDGEDVILVCSPKGDDDGTRRFGTLHAFKAESMEPVGSYEIDTGYTDQFFAYSDMAELDNGKLALIYEDGCINYKDPPWNKKPAGIGYSHISYTEIDLEKELRLVFDEPKDVFNWVSDNDTVKVQVPRTAGVTHMHTRPAEVNNMNVAYSAYEIVLCKDAKNDCTAEFTCANVHTGTAIVELPLTESLEDVDDVKGFVVNDNGSITSVFDVEKNETHVTFEAPHFSVVGIAAMTEEEIAQKNAVEVTLYSDETKTIILEGVAATGSHTSDAADVTWTTETRYTVTQGSGTSFGGAVDELADCLYTFTYSGTNDGINSYVIFAKTADGGTIYLKPYGNKGNPNSGDANTTVEVRQSDLSNEQIILCTSSGSLHFHNELDDPHWNQCSGQGNNEGCETLMLYRPVKEGETSSTELPGYVKIAGSAALANEVGNGSGQYLIVGKNHKENYYILYPTTATDSELRTQMAKVNGADAAKSETKITITGKTEDNTSVNIGGILYNITVEMDAVDVTLNAGENKTVTLDGVNYTTSSISKPPKDTVATIGSVVSSPIKGKELRAVTSVDDLSADKQYLIVANRPAGIGGDEVDSANSVLTSVETGGGLHMNGPASVDSTDLWTITPVTGGYTITQGNKYVSFGNQTAEFTETETVLALQYRIYGGYRTGWTIGRTVDNSTYYLSDLHGTGSENAYGYGTLDDNGNYWTIYEVASIDVDYTTDVTFNGVAGGNTEAVIGHTKFNITVNQAGLNEVEVELHVGETKTITDKTGNYTVSKAPAADIATVTVAGQDITETTVSTEKATTLEPGATYVIKLAGTDKAMSNQAGSRAWGTETRALVSFNGQAAEEHVLWTLEPAQGGYKLKNGNGSYLQLIRNAAPLTADGHVFKILYDGAVWTFQNVDNDEYFNNLDSKNCIGGWSGNGTKFDLYKVTTAVTGSTEITFTGVAEDKTQAIVGNTLYNITVLPEDVRDITLHVGENKTFSILDHAYTMADVTEPETYAELNTLTSVSPALTPVTAIESGKQYVFVNRGTGAVLTDRVITVNDNNNQNPKTGLDTTTDSSAKTAELWTVTGADGSYTVSQNGKYLTAAGYHADMSTTATNLTLRYTEYGWLIYDTETKNALGHTAAGYYLDDSVDSGYAGTALGTSNVGGKCGYWDICEVNPEGITEVVFTGVAVGGPTTAVIGHVTYNITVVQPESKQVKVELYAGASETFIIENIQYTAGNVTGPDGSGATLSVASGTSGTEVTITGVTAGTTATAEVGHVTYTITVKDPKIRDIVLYESVVTRDVIAGQRYTNKDADQPDNTYAYIHSVANNGTDTEVVFSGVKAGTTEAVIGDVTYNITVKSLRSGNDISDFNNIVGVDLYSDYNTNTGYRSYLDMAGKVIKSLRISEGASYRLGVDVTGYTDITWTSSDESIATVDAEGRVTAVKAGDTVITATVTKGDVTESISVCVKVVPSLVEGVDSDNITYIFYYMDQVHDTDAYYTLFLSSENTTGPVAGHEMVMVSEGEVIYIERPADAAMGWLWTADPWDNTALTLMGSSGSLDQYHPLQTPDGELGSGGVYYKDSDPEKGKGYQNIVNLGQGGSANWKDALDKTLQYSVEIGKGFWNDPGCDGAMSNSRKYNDGTPGMVSSMSFVSDRLPEITKTVDGVLPIERKFDNYRRYTEGADMVATVGEQVYFKLTITMERPHIWKPGSDTEAALQFADVVLSDKALGDVNIAFFYDKYLDNLDGLWDGSVPDDAKTNVLDDAFAAKHNQIQSLTEQLNAPWQADAKERVIEVYLVYTIQSSDIYKLSIDNTADLAYDVRSTYSLGSTSGTADAKASVIVSGAMMDNVVIDFGQKFTYTGLTEDAIRGATGEGKATYGDVYVDTTNNTITYTPHSILQNVDVVSIYGMDAETNQKRVINSFSVYPATTVYYEEGFMLGEGSTWNDENTEKATLEQTFERLGVAEHHNDTLTGHTSDKQHPYGYDPMYKTDTTVPGPSGGSYAAETGIGKTAVFEFTGTGFDLYANCTLDTGYVAITLQDENGKVVKLYTVNTAVKDASVTEENEVHAAEYHLPIVSELNLPRGTYTVEVRKIVNDGNEVRLDGVRIYNTVEDHALFNLDVESNPTFFELRDSALTAVQVGDDTSEKYGKLNEMSSQIYAALANGGEAPSAIITNVGDLHVYGSPADAQELLDNGPKNELFLYPGQTLTFAVKTARVMQLGLKAPVATTGYKLTYTVGDETEPTIVADGTYVSLGSTKDYAEGYGDLEDCLYTFTAVDGATNGYTIQSKSQPTLYLDPGNDPEKPNGTNSATVTISNASEEDEFYFANGSYLYFHREGTDPRFDRYSDTHANCVFAIYRPCKQNEASSAEIPGYVQVTSLDGITSGEDYLIVSQNGGSYYVLHPYDPTDTSVTKYDHAAKVGKGELMNTSVDMFYSLGNTLGDYQTYTVSVSNTGDNILSVTKLKISDDPYAQMVSLEQADIRQILLAAGYSEPEKDEDQTVDTTEPKVTEPEAVQPTEPKVTEPETVQPAEPENAFGCTKDIDCVLSKYGDIETTAWYHDGVHFCVAEGLMNGMGEGILAPNDATTRAQLVTMLYRMMGNPKAEGKTEPFTDVAEGEWYYDAIVWAYSENVVKGISETEFAPYDKVTREQVATILHRFVTTPEGTGKLDSFSDAASVSTYAKDAMVWAVGEGLINGVEQTNGTVLLDPTGTATRAQIATILYRYQENA